MFENYKSIPADIKSFYDAFKSSKFDREWLLWEHFINFAQFVSKTNFSNHYLINFRFIKASKVKGDKLRHILVNFKVLPKFFFDQIRDEGMQSDILLKFLKNQS